MVCTVKHHCGSALVMDTLGLYIHVHFVVNHNINTLNAEM
jgi:hypothetical protein